MDAAFLLIQGIATLSSECAGVVVPTVQKGLG